MGHNDKEDGSPQQEEDRPLLKLGEGFRADCEHLRLSVEVEHEGWAVGVYDLKGRRWITQGEKAADPQQGKARATEIASFVLERKDLQPDWAALSHG